MRRFIIALWLTLTASLAAADVDIKTITSPGGINAWVVEEPSIPFVALEIRMRGGTSLDLPGKRGAINLMMALIEEGSGDMTAQEFQAELETLAASFSYRVFDDTTVISAQFLTENRDEALALLRQSLIDPRFDQDAIDRVRTQVINGIASDEKSPRRIAGAYFNSAAFGDHPYGTNPDGTRESLAALTQSDIFDAYHTTLNQQRLFVSAVGDITADELGPLLDELLGDLPANGPGLPQDVPFGLGGGITVIHFDTPQSTALFGHAGIKRDSEDFFAAYILNEVLGAGGFESRLMHEVREKRGLTYGISTFLVPKVHAEMFLGQVASANESMAETVAVVRAEWARMASEGMTEEELATVKTFLTGEYPLRFDGNEEIAEIMVGMQMIGLPANYITNRNDYINAVTLEDVNRVARELLQPENLHFVVVGQPEGLVSSD